MQFRIENSNWFAGADPIVLIAQWKTVTAIIAILFDVLIIFLVFAIISKIMWHHCLEIEDAALVDYFFHFRFAVLFLRFVEFCLPGFHVGSTHFSIILIIKTILICFKSLIISWYPRLQRPASMVRSAVALGCYPEMTTVVSQHQLAATRHLLANSPINPISKLTLKNVKHATCQVML